MRRIPPTTSRKLDRFLRQQGFGEVPGRVRGATSSTSTRTDAARAFPTIRATSVPGSSPRFWRDARLSRDDYLTMS